MRELATKRITVRFIFFVFTSSAVIGVGTSVVESASSTALKDYSRENRPTSRKLSSWNIIGFVT